MSVSIFVARAIVEAVEQAGVERARVLVEVPFERAAWTMPKVG